MTTDHYHYASDLHQVAEEHHRHYDLEDRDAGQRQGLDSLRHRVSDLEDAIGELRQGLRELTVEVARLSAFMLPNGATEEHADQGEPPPLE
jgi:uncharacterized coiled-coil protein SlyX